MVGVIYEHKNRLNGKRYVGQTIQTIEARKREGYYNTKFANALRKYGWGNFETTILYELESDDKAELVSGLNLLEEIIIMSESLQDDEFGYNTKAGGSNGTFKHTPEAIEKIRVAARRPNSGQFRKGQSSPNKGKTWKNTEDYKRRHSTIMKQSYATTGRKSGMYGKRHSELSKARMSAAQIGKPRGQYPTHCRWHVARNIVSSLCEFCNE